MTREEEIRAIAAVLLNKFDPDGKLELSEYEKVVYCNGVIDAMKYVDEHPKKPWISVEERLPEKDGEYVLVYLPKHNEVFQAFLCDNEWIGAPTGEEVTHWMPIPQIEKGGEK